MKQIIAMVQPHRLEQIEHACMAWSICPDSRSFRRTAIPADRVRTMPSPPPSGTPTPTTAWSMMFCPDEQVPTVVEAIRAAAHTGHPGDGLIAVSELADVLRIRSGERGDAAL